MFVGYGDADPHVPIGRVRMTVIFDRLDADGTERIYDDAGHGLIDDEIEAIEAWLEELGEQSPLASHTRVRLPGSPFGRRLDLERDAEYVCFTGTLLDDDAIDRLTLTELTVRAAWTVLGRPRRGVIRVVRNIVNG